MAKKKRFIIKKLRPRFWAIYRGGCQLCHCKTKKAAEKRREEFKQGKVKERYW